MPFLPPNQQRRGYRDSRHRQVFHVLHSCPAYSDSSHKYITSLTVHMGVECDACCRGVVNIDECCSVICLSVCRLIIAIVSALSLSRHARYSQTYDPSLSHTRRTLARARLKQCLSDGSARNNRSTVFTARCTTSSLFFSPKVIHLLPREHEEIWGD